MKKLIALILFVILASTAKGQIITTIAGNSPVGFNNGNSNGDNGLAINAGLNGPAALALDTLGNLYIADLNNEKIRKISTAGIITTVAGTGISGYNGDNISALSADLRTPEDVDIDSFGNLLIADYNSHRIRKVSNGIITTVAGTGVMGYNGDNIVATTAQLHGPHSVSWDHSGNFFIADAINQRIRKVSSSGIITTVAGGGVNSPGDNGPATSAQISNPQGLTLDNAGNIYFTESSNTIRKVSTSGIITTIAGTGITGYGGDNGPAIQATLNLPLRLNVDKFGNVHFADEVNNRVRRIDGITGIITTVAGTGIAGYSGDGGLATNAQLYTTADVVIDTAGNLYIADAWNNRIRKVCMSATLPTINIASNQGTTICPGTNVTFTATPGSATSPSYQWIKNGVNVGTNSTTYTYTPANGDSIRCVISKNDACAGIITASSNTINMIVNPTVTPTISISPNPNDTVCASTSVTYTATITNGGTTPTYQWIKDGANVGTSSTTYTYTPNNLDSIRCVLTSNATCASPTTVSSNTINMVVNPTATPTINITASPSSTVCTGTSVTFTATITNGGATPSYQWVKNSINVGTNISTYTYTPNNGDIIKCVLTSNVACASSTTANSNIITMTVSGTIVPTVSIAVSPNDTVCAGTSVTFTANPVGGGTTPSYQWIKNGTNAGTNSSTYTYTPNNLDSVRCVLTSSAACASPTTANSNSIHLTVNPTVTPIISITVNPNDTVCAGTQVSFTANQTNGGISPTYQWIKNGVNSGTNNNTYTYTPNNLDSVRCTLTSNATCASPALVSSNTIDITVNPIIHPTISLSGTTLAPVGNPVTINATVTNAGSSYVITWMNHGIVFNSTTVPSVTYNKPTGIDTITAKIVSTDVGCYDSTISTQFIVQVEPNGINSITTSAIQVYPNPTNDVLHIDGVQENVTYRILNVVGATMQEGKLYVGGNGIAMAEYPAGMYLLQVRDSEGQHIIKIVKQ
ncbi:MAG: T9SS type A sorting domain-containing protein [Bacteroidota bacterium]